VLAFDFDGDCLTAVLPHGERGFNDFWPSAPLSDGSDACLHVNEALNFVGVLRDCIGLFFTGGCRQNLLLHI
jgi:hypothetical protein